MKSFSLQRLACSIFLFTASLSAAEDPAAAVKNADLARGAALRAADTNALNKILAPDFKYTHSDGYTETKAIHIRSFADGLRYSRFQTTNVVAHLITPDVVVLNGSIDQSKGKDGKMSEIRLLFHSVWRKTNHTWQIASLQTAVPPTPPK